MMTMDEIERRREWDSQRWDIERWESKQGEYICSITTTTISLSLPPNKYLKTPFLTIPPSHNDSTATNTTTSLLKGGLEGPLEKERFLLTPLLPSYSPTPHLPSIVAFLSLYCKIWLTDYWIGPIGHRAHCWCVCKLVGCFKLSLLVVLSPPAASPAPPAAGQSCEERLLAEE